MPVTKISTVRHCQRTISMTSSNLATTNRNPFCIFRNLCLNSMSESNRGLVEEYDRALTDLRVTLAAERRKSARLVADMKALQVQQREEAKQEIERLRDMLHNVNEENDLLRRQNNELEQQLNDVMAQMQQNTRAAEMRGAISAKNEKNLEARVQNADEEIQQLHAQLQHLATTHVSKLNTFATFMAHADTAESRFERAE